MTNLKLKLEPGKNGMEILPSLSSLTQSMPGFSLTNGGGDMKRCDCCGNTIKYTSDINAYWLQGKKYIYHICPECQGEKYRQFIFLRLENDVPKKMEACYV